MCDLYKEDMSAGDPVSLSTYKSVFYKNFNLRFKTPNKDTCKTCDSNKIAIDAGIVLNEKHLKYQRHMALADSQSRDECRS